MPIALRECYILFSFYILKRCSHPASGRNVAFPSLAPGPGALQLAQLCVLQATASMTDLIVNATSGCGARTASLLPTVSS